MSRITGSEVASLMEAYAAVYAPQELTEEQIWEEVENWVNSLLEEGYDLSEYTWEEMYEGYIEELFGTSPGERKLAQEREARINQQQQKVKDEKSKEASGARKALQGGKVVSVASNLGGLRSGTTVKMDSAATRAGGRTVLRATTQQGADAPEKSIRLGGSSYDRLTTKDGVKYIERKTPTKPTTNKPTADKPITDKPTADKPPVAPRPAATRPAAPKVSPSTPAKPAGPAMGKLGGTTFERRTPTSAELKAAQAARASGASPEKALQAAKAASAPKVAPSNALSSTVAAASKPAAFSPAPEVKAANTLAAKPNLPSVAPNRATGSKKPGSTFEEYDAYDLVLEYLLSQGHVETVEEAHYVMMEMDAETIGSIVEAGENIGPEPKTVGGKERPGVRGETYAERQKRMRPSSQVKDA